eukprot:TRINITY_DN483_c0_g6_i1.p1 TRINITY_DN483_c0_g6~~TRINITY_DN483_c0_g6_i1.p1  ORF type:complete len:1985 (+),score=368.79 TRINITY_DN483_c0_g6_i1:207-6161(+)
MSYKGIGEEEIYDTFSNLYNWAFGTKMRKIITGSGIAALLVIIIIVVAVSSSNSTKTFPLPPNSISSSGLMVIVRTDITRPNGEYPIVARSYDGNTWETVSDQDYPPVDLDCNSGSGCFIRYTEGSFDVKSLEVPENILNITETEHFARFLSQTTFGFQKSELLSAVENYPGRNYTGWIIDQMALPSTLLRSYFRQRTNNRQLVTGDVGTVIQPCEAGSRWHRYAFTYRDEGKTISIYANETSAFSFRVGGVLRTENSSFLDNDWPASNMSWVYPLQYVICDVVEAVDGKIKLTPVSNLTACNIIIKNPAINFTNPDPNITKVLAPWEANFVQIPGLQYAFISKTSIPCSLGIRDAFISYNNLWYRYDPRLKILTNTLESPANAPAQADIKCPAVVRTFLNNGTCLRRASCAPLTFTTAPVVLNDTTIRAWFVENSRVIYTLYGLRIEAPYLTFPCIGTSRWQRLGPGACPNPTSFDNATYTTLFNALNSSTDKNPFVRDITLDGKNCSSNVAYLEGQIFVNNECFQHVHPDLLSVRDFTYWSVYHDGNTDAKAANRPNPILKWAEQGYANVTFPSWHPMQRFYDKKRYIPAVGRYGDVIDFRALPTELQTVTMATRVGAIATRSDEGYEVCGSPGEVANEPTFGNRYVIQSPIPYQFKDREIDFKYPQWSGKSIVWTNVVLKSKDQLRQRVAWALAQIFTIGAGGSEKESEIEGWATYYDIFVRNAFGNYRDIMREVAYNPMMSLYLSFLQNKALAYSNSYPDENFAREIMQLFSIGLWKLNEDGTQVLDSNGNPISTYTNNDITEYARVWTGFDFQQTRSNVESIWGTDSQNLNDPLQLKPIWRDVLPKTKLDSGYLGDAYPLCDSLPPLHWLKEGARFVFTGGKSVEGSIMDAEEPTKSGYRGRFAPSRSSALYYLLCRPDSRGICTFPSEVVLNKAIECEDDCTAKRVISVKIYDPVANVTKYYTYVSVPCVRLTYFSKGKVTTSGGNMRQCTNPIHTVGNVACCNINRTSAVIYPNPVPCVIANEATDYKTADERCSAAGQAVCDTNYTWGGISFVTSCADGMYQWLNANCSLKAQVYLSGQVGIYDPENPSNGHKVLLLSSGNVHRVHWKGSLYPKAENNCTVGCTITTTVSGDTCVCDIDVVERVVFTDPNYLPTYSEVVSSLFVGAAKPSSFGKGVYSKCTTGPCASRSDVTVWVKEEYSVGWDETTIFQVKSQFAGSPDVYLANTESIVNIGSYSFRNPPHFMPLAGEQAFSWLQWASDVLYIHRAEQEVEALVDHLFQHQSTAPFVAYRMIQRMVTSNPSPRYVKSVVRAFKTGQYDGMSFSGKYGDLGATVAAIILDKEARSPVLEADPTFGVLREPLLKVIQVLRALEYQTRGSEVMLPELVSKIGMESFNSPTVFGFYLPENRPDGPISDHGLVSPEAQLGVSPLMVGFMNGMVSLIDNGLTPCGNGFGYNDWRSCDSPNVTADGWLMYRPNSTNTEDIIDDLDLLLTNRRLSIENKKYIASRYDEAIQNNVSTTNALKLVQKLFVLAPEFHTTNANTQRNKTRLNPPVVESKGRPYKAIVIIFQAGGCDSYSMLIPHSNCPAKDLHEEYSTVRAAAAIDKANLLPITVPDGTQPCNTFGLHSSMPFVKSLYDKKEALLFANVGPLVEPITKADFQGTSKVLKKFPPSLFAHNIQTRTIQNLDPQNVGAKGILGRAVTALTQQAVPYKCDLYSMVGSTKMLEGSQSPDFIDPWVGVVNFKQYSKLANDIGNFTYNVSQSAFSETYSKLLNNTIQKTETLGALLTNATLNTTFGNTYLSYQLKQVAKLIKLRDSLKSERAVFVTQKGGYDTHATFDMSELFGDVDSSLEDFSAEMKTQGIWDDVVVLTISEFSRTLAPNGQGTDHAWGGNYFLVGGKVNGGKILGKYPDTLTDEGSTNLGRGRFIPTTSWDAVWKGLAEWFGVEESQLTTVLPNLKNFEDSELFSKNIMFKQ